MDFAVSEFLVVDVSPLVALLGLLLDSGDFLSFLLRLGNLLLEDRDDLLIYMKVVIEICLDEVVYRTTLSTSAAKRRLLE